ncbi:hypothetical protein DFS33DRAFT_1364312 [Desarmillaria ectypa]|nr:hypothetical protein DFS33DRAFT_1364312 [Desarmillaria ectypa]
MAVIIFIGAPPPPHLLMDPFTLPKTKPKRQYRSKRYHRDARNRDASDASEPLSANEEPQKNHVDPLLPAPWLDDVNTRRTPSPSDSGLNDPSNDSTRPPSWITGRTPYSRGTTRGPTPPFVYRLRHISPNYSSSAPGLAYFVQVCHRPGSLR